MGQKTLPYSYGFENNNLAGEGWTMYNHDGGTGIVTYPYHAGGKSFRFSCGNNLSNPQYLITPLLSDSHILKLSFYTRVSNVTSIKYRVGYSTSNTPNITTNFEGWTTPVTLTTTTYSLVELTFEVEGIKYLAIEFDNYNSDTEASHYMSIDDVVIESISSCPTPSDLTCIYLTTNSATLDWTENGTADTWQMVYSTNPDFAPNSATPITVTTKPYTLRGLTTGTTYYAYVRSYCDADNQSAWSNKCAITPSTNVTLTANDDTKTNSSVPVYYYSINNASYDFRSQFIIPSSNLNVMKGGNIQKITFYNNNASLDYGDAEFDVYLGEVNYTTIESFCDWSNLSKVYSGGITVNSDKEMELSFSTAYTYQGGNLLIGFYRTKKGTNPTYDSWYGISTNYNSSIYATTSNAFAQFIPKTTFTYTPAIKFATAGNWNVTDNWYGNIPSSTDNVLITAAVTIPNGYTATANNITIDGGSLTIEDGGRLVFYNTGIQATVKKEISGVGDENWGATSGAEGWYFIASPVDDADFSTATTGDYDLYMLDWTSGQWFNQKNDAHSSLFENGFQRGTGYLYANKEDKTISVSGEILPLSGDDDATVKLAVDGWNLIGNPLTCRVTVDCPFTVLGDGGSGLINQLSGSAINPFQGIAVYGNADDVVTFAKANSQAAAAPNNNNSLQMTLAKKVTSRGETSSKIVDNAVVSFSESKGLPKFNMLGGNVKLYIPQNDEEYAVAFSNKQGDVPLNFKTDEVGTYTISFEGEEMDLNGIYLIDILEEQEIDLSVNPSYTFIGSPADRAERFVIRFKNAEQSENSVFAYQNGSDIVVTGEGELQIFDVMGRIVAKQYVSGVETINVNAHGVHIMKLNGMTQKIIIK